MLEKFIHEQGGSAVIPRRVWQRELARRWFRRGLELGARRRRAEAHYCFDRSRRIDPMYLRPHLRLLTRLPWQPMTEPACRYTFR